MVVSGDEKNQSALLEYDLHTAQLDMKHILNDINDYIATKYVEVKIVQDNAKLIGKVNRVCDKVQHLDYRVKYEVNAKVRAMAADLKKAETDLEDTKVACNTMKILLNIDLELDRMGAYLNDKRYTQAAKHWRKAADIIQVNPAAPLLRLDVYNPLNALIKSELEMLVIKLSNFWNQSVHWKIREILPESKICVLSITSSKEYIGQLMEALTACEFNKPLTNTFADNFYNHILTMCIKYKSRINIPEDKSMIEITSQLDSPPLFNEVVVNLTEVFLFLRETLNFELNDENYLCYLRVIGEKIEQKFIDALINECLYTAIPANLPLWEELVHEVINIQSLLKEIGFLSSTNKDLEDFCSSFEERQSDKIIGVILKKFESLSLDKFQNTITVGAHSLNIDNFDDNSILAGYKGNQINIKISNKELQKQLVPNVIEFPACKISTSTPEFIKIVKEMVSLASKEPTDVSLFGIARDIIEKFVNILKEHHKKFFSLAQQSALFYNNCWYIAHYLIMISEEFRDTLFSHKNRVCNGLVDLCTLVNEGTAALDQQISKQMECLTSTFKKSGLSNISDLESFPEDAKKSIKQCLHMLSFLKSLWFETLSNQVYSQVMGYMCNTFLNEIINSVLAARDIRSDIATNLVEVLSIIQEELPDLFPEPLIIFRHIRSWGKFKELVIILGANLLQISERWSEGKGPLAAEFSASHVRHLIKALFQDSTRRTALLSKIK